MEKDYDHCCYYLTSSIQPTGIRLILRECKLTAREFKITDPFMRKVDFFPPKRYTLVTPDGKENGKFKSFKTIVSKQAVKVKQ